MPVKGGACPVRDTLLCGVIMLGDFSPPQLSIEDVFFYLRSRAKLCSPAVVKSFALGFLGKPFDRYLTIAAHWDVKAVWKCQLSCVDLIFHLVGKGCFSPFSLGPVRLHYQCLGGGFFVKLLISIQYFR